MLRLRRSVPGAGIPTVATTWQWQLHGNINTSYTVSVYDIDLFEAPTGTISALKTSGKKVICYFSAGSSENWRPDYGTFDSRAIGQPLKSWAGENWLDIRSQNVLDIMLKRLDLAVTKGCDGVEPDNMDGYSNSSGFPLSATDQLAFNRRIANEAHTRGLTVALKNDGAQAASLVAYFDLSLNEQCHEFNECSQLSVFYASE